MLHAVLEQLEGISTTEKFSMRKEFIVHEAQREMTGIEIG